LSRNRSVEGITFSNTTGIGYYLKFSPVPGSFKGITASRK